MIENENKQINEIKDEKIDKKFNKTKSKSRGCIITIIVFLMIYVVAIILNNESINVFREVLITLGFAMLITILDRMVQLKRDEFEFRKEQDLFLYDQIKSIQNEDLKVSLLIEIIKE